MEREARCGGDPEVDNLDQDVDRDAQHAAQDAASEMGKESIVPPLSERPFSGP